MVPNESVVNPASGETFCLAHLQPFFIDYSIRLSGEPVTARLRVHFSAHCYTRSIKEGEDESLILFSEARKNFTDNRVFCPQRYQFSLKLPGIVEGLLNSQCLPAGQREMFYRLEDSPPQAKHHGWYLCLRLNHSAKHQNITLSVRSVHYRTNRPNDAVKHHKRFRVMLAEFIGKREVPRDWWEV